MQKMQKDTDSTFMDVLPELYRKEVEAGKEEDPYKEVPFRCSKKMALGSEVIMYDEETFEIVGYKKPICKLKE
jgi:hypothetical protein